MFCDISFLCRYIANMMFITSACLSLDLSHGVSSGNVSEATCHCTGDSFLSCTLALAFAVALSSQLSVATEMLPAGK